MDYEREHGSRRVVLEGTGAGLALALAIAQALAQVVVLALALCGTGVAWPMIIAALVAHAQRGLTIGCASGTGRTLRLFVGVCVHTHYDGVGVL